MPKRNSPAGAGVLRFALIAFLCGTVLRPATAQPGTSPRRFKLTGPGSSFLLAKEYPRSGLHLDFSVRYEKPGMVFDTVGLNAAPAGAWTVVIVPDGKLTVQLFDKGWHLLTSVQKLAAGQTHHIVLDFTGAAIVLRVNDTAAQTLPLTTPLSGQPVWVGDFPGDDQWGPRYNIHPAFTGELSIMQFGAAPPGLGGAPVITSGKQGFEAGPILAEARVGPAGGTIESKGKVRITLPKGALENEEKMLIRQMTLNGNATTFYEIERDGVGLLHKPAEVVLPLPEGTDATQVCVFHGISSDLAAVVPARYDAASKSMVTSTMSFSTFGWDSYSKYLNESFVKAWQGGLTGGGALVGGTVIVAIGAAAVTGPAAGGAVLAAVGFKHLGVAVVVGAIGNLAGGDAVTKYGLDCNLTVKADPQVPEAEFNINWAGSEKALQRFQVTAVTDTEGRLLGWLPGGVTDAQLRLVRQDLGNALGPQVDATQPLATRQVPLSVLRAGVELCLARHLLKGTGLAVPDKIKVLIRETGATDAGAWDPPFLNIGLGTLTSTPGDTAAMLNRQATLLHEYYHATCHLMKTTNNTYLWLEEAIAVSLEAEFLNFEGYFTVDESGLNFDWPNVGTALASGFVNRRPELGAAEDYSKVGYRLWPWARWLTHSQGPAPSIEGWPVLWRAAADGLTPAQISPLFENFALAILTSDQALADPAPVKRPFDVTQDVKTGWARRRLVNLRVAEGLLPGRVNLPPYLAAPRPLSLNVLGVRLPQGGGPGGPLVVRRSQPCQDEAYWLLPQSAWTAFTPTATLRRARGCLVVPATALSAGEWPLALVNSSTADGAASPLLCYRLNPPLKLLYKPATGEQKGQLSWSPPDLGAGLKPSDCLKGYRLHGRTKEGKEELIGEIFFDLPEASLWQLPGKLAMTIPATGSQIELPADKIKHYADLGLQSTDKVLGEGGKLLMSDIAWSGIAEGQWVLENKEIHDNMMKPGKSERTQGTDLEIIDTFTCKISEGSAIFSKNQVQNRPLTGGGPEDGANTSKPPRYHSATFARQATWTPGPENLVVGSKFAVQVRLKTAGSGAKSSLPLLGYYIDFGKTGGSLACSLELRPAAGAVRKLRTIKAYAGNAELEEPASVTITIPPSANEGDVLVYNVDLQAGLLVMSTSPGEEKFSYQAVYTYRFQPAAAKSGAK